MTEEEKQAIEKAKKEAQENIEKLAKETAKKEAAETAKATAEEATKAYNEKLAEIEKKYDDQFKDTASKEEIEKTKEDFKKDVTELQARMKAMKQTTTEKTEKSFNDHLAEVINENAEFIKSQANSKGNFEKMLTMKAVGDMSITTNFPGATPFIQQVQPGLLWNPYNRVWLSDLLPQATSTANSVIYPKENGGEGGVGFWDKTGNKPQVDYDFTTQAAFFKWIAGFVVVEREMLDDIPWLTSYLQQKLLIGLKIAENNFILNGTSDATNPVQGLLAAATAYDGTFTNFVEMIIDAAFGQIPSDTEDFYIPSNVILHPRDTVAIGLNKAIGSGEYDLPQGSVTFGAGRLNIAGLDTVATTQMARNNFLTLGRDAVMFLRRMQPEIRMFEDAALAKVNKVMFRIEERVTQVIFNDKALVKGTYVPEP